MNSTQALDDTLSLVSDSGNRSGGSNIQNFSFSQSERNTINQLAAQFARQFIQLREQGRVITGPELLLSSKYSFLSECLAEVSRTGILPSPEFLSSENMPITQLLRRTLNPNPRPIDRPTQPHLHRSRFVGHLRFNPYRRSRSLSSPSRLRGVVGERVPRTVDIGSSPHAALGDIRRIYRPELPSNMQPEFTDDISYVDRQIRRGNNANN